MTTGRPLLERRWWLLKIVVFLISCWFIWWHVHTELNMVGAAASFFREEAFSGDTARCMLLVCLLALINWSLEAVKWKFLISKTEAVSFIKSLRAFFNGITLSFFTPNRIGEFAGRVIYLRGENRITGALLSFIGSAAQLLVTIQCGAIAAMLYIDKFIELQALHLQLLRTGFFLLLLISTWCWWNMPKLVRITDKLNIRTSWKEKVHIWDRCSSADLIRVWALSFLRYAVFTTQSVLMFKAVGVNAGSGELAGLTALSYIFITIIPSIALGELGIRGSVNIALFGYAGALSSDILLATFGIWLINLAFPALFGAISVLFLKIRKHTTG